MSDEPGSVRKRADSDLAELKNSFAEFKRIAERHGVWFSDETTLLGKLNKIGVEIRANWLPAALIGALLVATNIGLGIGIFELLGPDDWQAQLTDVAEPSQNQVFVAILRYLFVGAAVLFALFGLVAFFAHAFRMRNAKTDFKTLALLLNEPVRAKVQELQDLSRLSDQLASALRSKLLPYMLSWKDSQRAEEEAKSVKAVSPDIAWLTTRSDGSSVFCRLVMDVSKNPDNTYQYLLFRRRNPAFGNPTWQAETVIQRLKWLRGQFENLTSRQQSLVEKNIQIRMATPTNGHINCLHFSWRSGAATDKIFFHANKFEERLADLPLPGDMVVYSGLPDFATADGLSVLKGQVLVMSKGLVSGSTEPENQFDFVFTEPAQISSFETWFKKVWDSCDDADC